MNRQPPRAWCAAGLDDAPLEGLEFIALDVETTGLRPGKDKLTEVAAFEAVAGQLEAGNHMPELVNWCLPNGPEALLDGLVLVRERLALGAVLAGHNLAFDVGFIREVPGVDPALATPHRWLCTMRLTGSMTSLEALASSLGVSVEDRHTARGDALTTGRTLLALNDRARVRGSTTVAGLAAACPYSDAPRRSKAELEAGGWGEIRARLDHVVPVVLPTRSQWDAFRSCASRLRDLEAGPEPLSEANDVIEELRAANLTATVLDLFLAEAGIGVVSADT